METLIALVFLSAIALAMYLLVSAGFIGAAALFLWVQWLFYRAVTQAPGTQRHWSGRRVWAERD